MKNVNPDECIICGDMPNVIKEDTSDIKKEQSKLNKGGKNEI